MSQPRADLLAEVLILHDLCPAGLSPSTAGCAIPNVDEPPVTAKEAHDEACKACWLDWAAHNVRNADDPGWVR